MSKTKNTNDLPADFNYLSGDPEDFLKGVMLGKLEGVTGNMKVDAAKSLMSAKSRREAQNSFKKQNGLGMKKSREIAAEVAMQGGGWSNLLAGKPN